MPRKVHVVYFDYPNTSGNHTGMAYFAKQLKSEIPGIVLHNTPKRINTWHNRLQKIWRNWIIYKIKSSFKNGDSVLFLEYLTNASGWQTEIALSLRKKKLPIKLFGLVHLSGTNLMEIYKEDVYIKKCAEALDKIIVFGSSLETFFNKLGFSGKVVTTFHYVDTNYYKPSNTKNKNNKLRVICIGNIKRNFDSLKSIISKTPSIEYHICAGKSNLNALFSSIQNVQLYGYISEDELLKLMQQCDVSLSVLNDTVGSNVITTSLACGLINVVSDVGSIRDYCDDFNSIICKDEDDIVKSLHFLETKPEIINDKRRNAIKKGEEFNLNSSINAFIKILNN